MVFDIPRLYIKTPPGQLPRDGKTVFYSLKGNQRKAGMKKPGIFNKYRAFTWQREKDSNPHIRSQSPLCYLYTIPLNARAIIHGFADLSRANSLFFCILFTKNSGRIFPGKPALSVRQIVADQQINTGAVAFQAQLLVIAL